MQSVSSRIWTHVAVSISYDDNHYTTGTSYFILTCYISVSTKLTRARFCAITDFCFHIIYPCDIILGGLLYLCIDSLRCLAVNTCRTSQQVVSTANLQLSLPCAFLKLIFQYCFCLGLITWTQMQKRKLSIF